eukprot:scaffold8936_cov61-Phaeocystis_antarctica.AAC.18
MQFCNSPIWLEEEARRHERPRRHVPLPAFQPPPFQSAPFQPAPFLPQPQRLVVDLVDAVAGVHEVVERREELVAARLHLRHHAQRVRHLVAHGADPQQPALGALLPLPAEVDPTLVQLLRLPQQLLVAGAQAPGGALQRREVRGEQQVVRLGVGLDT